MSEFLESTSVSKNFKNVALDGPKAIFLKDHSDFVDSDDEEGENAGHDNNNDKKLMTTDQNDEEVVELTEEEQEIKGIEAMIEMLRHVALADQYIEAQEKQLEQAIEANFDLLDDITLKVLEMKISSGLYGYNQILDAFHTVSRKKLEAAGELLRALITISKGDARTLKTLALSYARKGQLDSTFMNVLEANIEACQKAQLVVKAKVLTFLRDEVILKEIQQPSAEENTGQIVTSEDQQYEALRQHHAPVFTAENNISEVAGTVCGSADPTSPDLFLDCPGYSELLMGKRRNNSQKRVATQKSAIFATKIANSLKADSFAIVDNFMSINAIRCIRAEMGMLDAYYKQSEIWVGKEAGLGAQIHFPDVRGDKVLWMCGGHSRAAGVVDTREVEVRGQIEPCDLKIKHKAKRARFSALKKLIKALDKLVVGELKDRVPHLNRIIERSDAMLATYPGGGARFQKHIDNTAKDGRVLTVVIYLNPNWEKTDGGAIRIYPPTAEGPIDAFPEAARICMFFSDVMPHEVLPCHAHRHAMTLWYYDEDKRQEAVKRASDLGIDAGTDVRIQEEAKTFMLDIITGATNGNHKDVINSLCAKADTVSEQALTIVANIVGAPSPTIFKHALGDLTEQGLEELTNSLNTMGIN